MMDTHDKVASHVELLASSSLTPNNYCLEITPQLYHKYRQLPVQKLHMYFGKYGFVTSLLNRWGQCNLVINSEFSNNYIKSAGVLDLQPVNGFESESTPLLSYR
jgi:hypothetical protein